MKRVFLLLPLLLCVLGSACCVWKAQMRRESRKADHRYFREKHKPLHPGSDRRRRPFRMTSTEGGEIQYTVAF